MVKDSRKQFSYSGEVVITKVSYCFHVSVKRFVGFEITPNPVIISL